MQNRIVSYQRKLNTLVTQDQLDNSEAGFLYGYELDAKKTIEGVK